MPTAISEPALDSLSVRSRAPKVLLKGLVAVVVGLALIPAVYLFFRASEKSVSEITQLLLRAKTIEVLTRTSLLVLCVVSISLVFGVAIATGLHFVRLPFRRLMIIPAVLPLAIPSYVFTYTWIALVPSFSGFGAAVFILFLSTVPYIVLATLAGLRRVDGSQIEVAQSLGLSYRQIFFRVILPQIQAHISAGALLVGLYTTSDFGAVSLLNVETLTVSIQNMYRASYDRSAAAVISFVLIAFATLFVLADEKIKANFSHGKVVKTFSTRNTLIRKKSLQVSVITSVLIFAFLALVIPVFVLITRFLSNPVAINYGSLAESTISTISVAAMGALIALVLSAPIAILLSGKTSAFGKFAQRVIVISHGLPGVVIGLALVSIGSKLGALYQTTFLLAFAYALLFLAKSMASTNSSLSQVPASAVEVAATLGMNQGSVIRKVIAPIAAPGIGLGTLLVFLTSMKELPATLMLRPTGFETLATQIWSSASINRFNEAAPYALILVLVAAIPTFFVSRPDKADQAFIYEDMKG